MNTFSNTCLADRTYLVTGGSSGIGLKTAQLIADCGGKVVIVGRNQERLDVALSSLSSSGHLARVADLQMADQTHDWLKSIVEDTGPLGGMFHCSGIEMIRPVKLTKQQHLSEIFGSSLFAAFGLARAMSSKNAMLDGGSLVFMSSVAGSHGQTGMTAYSAAKAGIEGLARSLACELAPRQIRVNAIAPGAVKTPMHDRLMQGSNEAAMNNYEQSHLLGFGEPQDIANIVVFLLSNASRWMTGSTLFVDGGYTVR